MSAAPYRRPRPDDHQRHQGLDSKSTDNADGSAEAHAKLIRSPLISGIFSASSTELSGPPWSLHALECGERKPPGNHARIRAWFGYMLGSPYLPPHRSTNPTPCTEYSEAFESCLLYDAK